MHSSSGRTSHSSNWGYIIHLLPYIPLSSNTVMKATSDGGFSVSLASQFKVSSIYCCEVFPRGCLISSPLQLWTIAYKQTWVTIHSFHLCSCLLGIWRPFPCLIPMSSFLYKLALQLLLLLQVFSLGSFLEQDASQLCRTVDSMYCHIFHIFCVVLHFKCSLAPRWKWTKITVIQINNLTPHFPE